MATPKPTLIAPSPGRTFGYLVQPGNYNNDVLQQGHWVQDLLRSYTAFPASPSSGDTCFRSDLGAWYRYDGTTGTGTVSTAITGTGSQTVTTTAAHGLAVGDAVLIDAELVPVTAVPSSTTFTASWGTAHVGSSTFTFYRWRQMGAAFYATASRPANPPTGYLYVDTTDNHTYRYTGTAYVTEAARLRLLDWTASTDIAGASLTASTYNSLFSAQSFTVVDAASTIEVTALIGTLLFGGSSELALAIVIDSTTHYSLCSAYFEAASTFIGLPGNTVNIGSLSAGSHTVQAQVYPLANCTIYCRASSVPINEFLRIQVHENHP